MTRIKKVLATTSFLAMSIIPMTASAQNIPSDLIHNGQGFTVNQVKAAPGTVGQITNFVNDKTGKFITVTGHGLATTDQSEIILSITKSTKIIDSKGKKVSLKKIIDDKKVVKAFYGPNITKSLPARGKALKLVVQDEKFTGINGTVSEVTGSGIVVKGTDIYNSNKETIVLNFADKAQILNQDGKAIKASAIQPGMSVKAFYGPAVTMSIPAQSTTNYVVVNLATEETVQENALGTNGIITNVTDNKITVIGNPMEKGGVNYVILSVDKNTQIVDQKGTSLTLDALKADVRVDAYYGEMITMIYPAQTYANKIVVKAIENNKVEGTIVASDRTTKDQVYVNVGSDQSINNDVILNISKDTKVIPVLGGGTELKAGMKIVVYHSPVMTKSLPGITNAEIVIVTSDGNTVASK
ncbi:peptidase [Viridibacillus sp. YIM B01967]|uniref:Peptidase n=1 Tax=Viridibacillus soli TaxID=2798301 RepID=A0ABS1H8Y1_9BACL|nr:peptidase [Viridibacillus soli]MBK3495764.1 peptidase [Viridibacillus soli]